MTRYSLKFLLTSSFLLYATAGYAHGPKAVVVEGAKVTDPLKLRQGTVPTVTLTDAKANTYYYAFFSSDGGATEKLLGSVKADADASSLDLKCTAVISEDGTITVARADKDKASFSDCTSISLTEIRVLLNPTHFTSIGSSLTWSGGTRSNSSFSLDPAYNSDGSRMQVGGKDAFKVNSTHLDQSLEPTLSGNYFYILGDGNFLSRVLSFNNPRARGGLFLSIGGTTNVSSSITYKIGFVHLIDRKETAGVIYGLNFRQAATLSDFNVGDILTNNVTLKTSPRWVATPFIGFIFNLTDTPAKGS